MNKWLNFGDDPNHSLDTGIVFWIRHYWEIWKVVNGHSFMLIRQMAALVRRALAEVCTVSVLLVLLFFCLELRNYLKCEKSATCSSYRSIRMPVMNSCNALSVVFVKIVRRNFSLTLITSALFTAIFSVRTLTAVGLEGA